MKIQWLGHSAFKVTGDGAQVLFDPFLSGNPKFAGDFAETVAGTTHVLLTHGHNDHFGDTVEILRATGATLVATPELCGYVGSVLDGAKVHGMNIGGSHDFGPLSVTMTKAFHSSAYTAPDGRVVYGGMPTGLIAHLGGRRVHHMGDTDAFADMALIAELWRPDIGLVPIGDNFTMGPEQAALAVDRFFDFEAVIPCHYGTFPVLEPTAARFAAAVRTAKVLTPAPMETVEV